MARRRARASGAQHLRRSQESGACVRTLPRRKASAEPAMPAPTTTTSHTCAAVWRTREARRASAAACACVKHASCQACLRVRRAGRALCRRRDDDGFAAPTHAAPLSSHTRSAMARRRCTRSSTLVTWRFGRAKTKTYRRVVVVPARVLHCRARRSLPAGCPLGRAPAAPRRWSF